MTLESQMKQIAGENAELRNMLDQSNTLLAVASEKIAELESRITPGVLAELKELQLISLAAQVDVSESTHENTMIAFSALAEIFETIGVTEE